MDAFRIGSEDEFIGVNTRQELEKSEAKGNTNISHLFMRSTLESKQERFLRMHFQD